jgi:hypothetical protein
VIPDSYLEQTWQKVTGIHHNNEQALRMKKFDVGLPNTVPVCGAFVFGTGIL